MVRGCAHLIILVLWYGHCLSQVLIPPTFLYPDKKQVVWFRNLTTATLKCSATGQPPARYNWTLDDRPVTDTIWESSDWITGVLTVNTFAWSRTCRCTATVDFNSTSPGVYQAINVSPPVELKLVFIRDIGYQQVTPISKMQYEYLSIRCVVDPRNKPEAEVIDFSWYRTTSNVVVRDGNRIFIDKEGTIHFVIVVLKEAEDSIYCAISTSIDNITITRKGPNNSIGVTPRTVDVLPKQKPILEHSTPRVTARLFTDAILECVFSGFDPQIFRIPSQTWTTSTGKLMTSSPKFIVTNKTLTVKNVSEIDEGTYTCVGTNSQGQTSANLFLDVTSEPIFLNGPPADQTVTEGSNATFDCQARSLQNETAPTKPAWFVNGEQFVSMNDTTKFQLNDMETRLQIVNVQKLRDIMCIQCEVRNDQGTTYGRACLNVILPMRIVSTPPAFQRVRCGEQINLTVQATADPGVQLAYRWEYNGHLYEMDNLPSYYIIDQASMKVIINTSLLDEDGFDALSGLHRITVYHDFETQVVETLVETVPGIRTKSTTAETTIEVSTPSSITTPVVTTTKKVPQQASQAKFTWPLLIAALLPLAVVIFLVVRKLCSSKPVKADEAEAAVEQKRVKKEVQIDIEKDEARKKESLRPEISTNPEYIKREGSPIDPEIYEEQFVF